jgi:drug/metabolite transporter (DMT)-like permease
MNQSTKILILLLAATLEAGGDALMRVGLHRGVLAQRLLLFLLAGVVLFAYGWTVNAPSWEFGKLIGIYVVFFFLIAQLIAWAFFKESPSSFMLIGGALIVAGGIVISLAPASSIGQAP